MQVKTFYRKDKIGNIRQWSIEVEDRSFMDYSVIKINAGIIGGQLIPTDTDIIKGLGGKTHYEQAVADAKTEINKKIKLGYVEDISQVKEYYESATIPKPMKGYHYRPDGSNKSRTLQSLGLLGKRIIVQRKLDGWRFRIKIDEFGCTFYTNSGDVHAGFAHIEASLVKSFRKHVKGVDYIYLDGEIYNHELGYYRVAGICGTTVNWTPEKIVDAKKMQFHLFDAVLPCVYEERIEVIEMFYSDCVLEVENFFIIASDEELQRLFKQFLDEGYEGLMFRKLDEFYKNCKCTQLTKFKPFIDAEFKIIGFLKSITGDTLGALVCENEEGKVFNSDLKERIGTDEYKRKIWFNQSKYINRFVTVEFFEYTPDGVPRNGKAKSFRKGQGID